MILGQFLPASERCDDPLLAVLESPSTVNLILDQMFMHIKPSPNLDTSSPVSTPEQHNDKINSPTKPDTSEDHANEEDDAGGGINKFKACLQCTPPHGKVLILIILDIRVEQDCPILHKHLFLTHYRLR